MGNTASTESANGNGPGGGGGAGGNGAGPSNHPLNSLSRPRSHGGAAAHSRDQADRSASPSWSRHGSIKRESSQTPTQHHARNPFFRENTATPTPFSAASLRRGRSGSASLPAPASAGNLAPGTASGRERSVTSDTPQTTSQAGSPIPNQKLASAGSSTPHGFGSLRRPSRFRRQKSIDLQDVDQDLKISGLKLEEDSKSAPPTAGLTVSSPTSQILPPFAPFISPCPSPSIATNPRHAAGTNSYVMPDATETTSPASNSNAEVAHNRAFGRGVAAIFSTPGQSLGTASMATQGSTEADRSAAQRGVESSDADTSMATEGYPSTSSGPPTTDDQGREFTTALPSYLRIPTLISSKQEPAPPSAASIPSSPTGSAMAIGSGQATPASSGWSSVAGMAGRATDAVLTTEDVVIAPGEASRVSSPSLEDRQFPGASGVTEGMMVPVDGATPTNISDSEQQAAQGDGSDQVSDGKGATSLSRTPTPTQKSHAAKAFTPARTDREPSSHAEAAAHAAHQENLRKIHIATGLASGVTTPVMPIPPGLTPAPPSASSPSVRSNDAATAAAAIAAGLGISTPVANTPARDDEPKTPTSSTTPKQRHPPAHLTPYYYKNAKGPISLMPIVVTWRGGGKEVFVTGTFANEWRSKILLKKAPVSGGRRSAAGGKDEFSVVLHLPAGTHRMKFIVDDRWRVSRELPTASDGDGNLVNYLEIPNVGPAHPGPLSAPGEDLPDGAGIDRERERRREREVEKIKEAGRAAAAASRRRQAEGTDGTSLDSAFSDSSQGVAHDQLQREARRKAVMDLREEARKAELLRRGQLEEAFGLDDEALRAAETWVQEIPESVMKAQHAEEEYRDRMESQPPPSHHHQHQDHDDGNGPPVPPPPSLPRQLEKVILNSSPANPALAPPGGLVDDNSVLPAPNHVVLNHLTASSIKGGVLAVGTTTRYKRKYVTTVFYRPVQA